jgi:nucleoside transporter
MSGFVRLQLSIMMFLQYAIWGSWGVTMATYLGTAHKFQGVEIGWVYNTMQIGAILSPLFIGIIADRLFATQTVLSICHLAGAGILFAAAQADTPRNVFLLMLAYGMLFMPTLALSNSISFRNMNDPDRQFPGVRVLGTIGWIAAGLVVGGTSLTADGQIGFDIGTFHLGAVGGKPIADTNNILYLAAGLSALLGVFCVTLPHTPPVKVAGAKQPSLFAALGMLKEPSFAILMLISFGISVALAFYYQLCNPFLVDLKLENSAQWQTLGQWSEIVFMLALPFIVTTLGVKWTLLLGMLAWCVRYGIFYTQDLTWIKALGLPLHGICYDFFFVVSQLYVDQRAPRELRASAQGLLTLITLGLGMFVGNILAGYAKDLAQVPPIEGLSLSRSFLPTFLWEPTTTSAVTSTTHWPSVWAPAAIGCGIAVVLFFVGFREPKKGSV